VAKFIGELILSRILSVKIVKVCTQILLMKFYEGFLEFEKSGETL